MVIYSRATCAPCRTLKYWLQKKQIDHTCVDVDEHPNPAVTIVPTAEIDGQMVVGLPAIMHSLSR